MTGRDLIKRTGPDLDGVVLARVAAFEDAI
jgi:hypothetical protein